MYSIDAITTMAAFNLGLEQAQVRQAATNIANFNKPSATALVSDFALELANASDSMSAGDINAVKEFDFSQIESTQTSMENISLDQQVQLMTDAEERFRVISEIYTRRTGIKSSVYMGGQ